ncbi:sorting nexin-10 [Ambystoma mexicanum]|uniref:sorting nexin-10 n=1 Tax=Ambystoma mexicanum TaxID=8296 RepID=UPI0037E7DD00
MRLQEVTSVWVRDPQLQKEDYWHSYIDYEICVHTNSMCFTLKTSRVRRRFREFVWLRERLQNNARLIELPELPPKSPFFKLGNSQQMDERRQGLQDFLQKVLQSPFLLSDSRLHLFLQSQLSTDDIEACVSGQTKYSVTDAIRKFASSNRRFPEESEKAQVQHHSDYDSESSSSGPGHGDDSISHGCSADKGHEELKNNFSLPAPVNQS